MQTEQHPLKPFLPPHARLLMLGSFPPPKKRWSMDFYYPNLNNDMWRIVGLIYYGDKNHFVEAGGKAFNKTLIVDFLEEKGIALFDTASEVCRLKENAADQFLEVVKPTDIRHLLQQLPLCRAIAVTGQKAMDTLRAQIEVAEPKIGQSETFEYAGRLIRLYRMPSSSRAYPLALDRKVEVYRHLFMEELITFEKQ